MPDSRSKDLAEILTYLSETPLIPNPVTRDIALIAKKIHDATYSLVLWRYCLSKIPKQSKPFVEEIVSDALQILPQVLLGYTRPTKLLLRGIIENTLKFIYFIDHPVEYKIMNEPSKWYMGVDKLFDYTKSHPNYKISEKSFDAINRLQSLYSELSGWIHGRTVKELETRLALNKIAFSISVARKELKLVTRCAEAVNFLLAIENRAELRSFSTEDKTYIFTTMPKAARALWHDYTGVLNRE